LQKPVAVKLLRAAAARDPAVVARFLREARAAGRPVHPGIVGVQDDGRLSDGRPFLVMELVETPTLQWHMEQAVAPPTNAVRIARGIASALEAALAAR
jgi:serine/threonine-protein kinase